MKRKFTLPVSLDILVLIGSLCLTFILWRVAATFPPDQIPLYVFTIGIFASFMLFVMVFGLSRAEKKAQEADIAHWRLISAIESLPLGLIITDVAGNVILANYQLSVVLDEKIETISLKEIDKRLHDDISIAQMHKDVIERRRSIPWKKFASKTKKLEVYMAPIFSEARGILGTLILLRDDAGSQS